MSVPAPATFQFWRLERVGIELQSNSLTAEARKIGCDRFDIEATGQSKSGERKAIGIPTGCTAQLGKRLTQPWRCNHDLARAEAPGLDIAGGENAVAQQDQARAALDPHF